MQSKVEELEEEEEEEDVDSVYAAIRVGKGNVKEVEAYLDADIDVNDEEVPDTGRTLLYWAVILKRPQIINLLLSRGADVNFPRQMHAIMTSSGVISAEKFIIQVMEETRVDVDQIVEDKRNDKWNGRTLLMCLLKTEKTSCKLINCLLSKGANVNARDRVLIL